MMGQRFTQGRRRPASQGRRRGVAAANRDVTADPLGHPCTGGREPQQGCGAGASGGNRGPLSVFGEPGTLPEQANVGHLGDSVTHCLGEGSAMRRAVVRLSTLLTILVLTFGCSEKGKDDVDPNPGKGDDVPGDVKEDKGDGG